MLAGATLRYRIYLACALQVLPRVVLCTFRNRPTGRCNLVAIRAYLAACRDFIPRGCAFAPRDCGFGGLGVSGFAWPRACAMHGCPLDFRIFAETRDICRIAVGFPPIPFPGPERNVYKVYEGKRAPTIAKFDYRWHSDTTNKYSQGEANNRGDSAIAATADKQ
jgi:hypothetical protein